MRYVNTATRYTGASRRARVRFAVPLIALCAFAVPALATTYKWVDEHGVVHYTDKVPPEQIDKARIELDKQGVPVKKVDPAPTPEQRKAREAEEARQRELARQQEDVARKNKALLQSYSSEAEIDLARKRALSTLDSVIQSAQAYSDQLKARKDEVDRKKAEFGTKPIPAALEREATTVDVELVRQNELIAQKRRETVEVQQKYDAILARWRELTSSREATDAALAAPPAPAGGYTDTATKK
jgi:DNA repair exonuclease SbcCD ATPase subunit